MNTDLLAAFAQQVAWCAPVAPFTSRLLARSRCWLAATPDAHAAFSALSDNPLAAAVALRWAAGLHLLALHGLQPWAGLWPSNGPSQGQSQGGPQASDAALDAAIALAWQTQRPLLQDALSRAPQTNEVQRSAALLPGLLYVAQCTGLPLVLLEIGASAGLNLWCDRYRYIHHHAPPVAAGHTAWTWGDPQAPLALHTDWTGPMPWAPASEAPALQVLRRAACDAHPVDLRQPGEALRGASFIWPEQHERLVRLRTAQAAAAHWMGSDGLAVQAVAAGAFVEQALHSPQPGAATVLMHSVVWQYIQPPEQQAIVRSIEAAGSRATAQAPLAWLRLEPPRADLRVELRCRLWPGGDDSLLATAHPHGNSVQWLQ